MYNILLIDDLRDFKVHPAVATRLDIARTSAEALAFLNGDTIYQEIWFDHDLGITDDGKDDTTMIVVDFLSERAFNDDHYPVETVFVHTANPVGAGNITRALNNYGYRNIRVDAAEFFTA